MRRDIENRAARRKGVEILANRASHRLQRATPTLTLMRLAFALRVEFPYHTVPPNLCSWPADADDSQEPLTNCENIRCQQAQGETTLNLPYSPLYCTPKRENANKPQKLGSALPKWKARSRMHSDGLKEQRESRRLLPRKRKANNQSARGTGGFSAPLLFH